MLSFSSQTKRGVLCVLCEKFFQPLLVLKLKSDDRGQCAAPFAPLESLWKASRDPLRQGSFPNQVTDLKRATRMIQKTVVQTKTHTLNLFFQNSDNEHQPTFARKWFRLRFGCFVFFRGETRAARALVRPEDANSSRLFR